jgi:peptidoglycan/LPS O-acetylase OafA/YrhL
MGSQVAEIAAVSAPPASPARLAFLDGVRGVAALFVVLHHAYLTIWAGPHGPYGMPSSRVQTVGGWMLFGRLAVDVFIVLSGYCLMLPVLRHRQLKGGALPFYRRRIRRIIPTYYASIALSLLLIFALIGHRTGTHWDASLPVSGHAIMNAVLLVQNFGPPRINHVFWSIAVESQI